MAGLLNPKNLDGIGQSIYANISGPDATYEDILRHQQGFNKLFDQGLTLPGGQKLEEDGVFGPKTDASFGFLPMNKTATNAPGLVETDEQVNTNQPSDQVPAAITSQPSDATEQPGQGGLMGGFEWSPMNYQGFRKIL